jgi:peptidoglycan/LPS O-acetylase OafA/YrhL
MDINISKEFQILPYIIGIMFLGSLYRKIHDDNNHPQLYLYTILATLMCFGLPLFLLVTSLLELELVEGAFRFGASHSLAILLFFIGIKYFNKPPKFMLWLGAISYSLYLFHPIILEYLLHFINNSNFSSLQGFHVIIYMTIITITSIIFASILYKYIEVPSINLGRKLSK